MNYSTLKFVGVITCLYPVSESLQAASRDELEDGGCVYSQPQVNCGQETRRAEAQRTMGT
ncbi:MAG: hypothetical protein LBF72_02510 [Holosporales bacterium]|nr:hypothetical protein [Holosporales bacterium]